MKNARKASLFRLTEQADNWVTTQAKQQGISKNDIIQMLINKAMQSEVARP